MKQPFAKALLFCALMLAAPPASACFSDMSGSIGAWSNKNDVTIRFGTAEIPTSRYPNSWEIIEDDAGQGAVFKFVINTDKAETKWNGLRLAFHTQDPVSQWEDGKAVTFAPYSSLTGSAGSTGYPAFSCGKSAGGKAQILPGYFGGDFIDQDPALSRRQAIWYIDSLRSKARIKMTGNTIAQNGKFTVSGVLELVYVNELPDSAAGSALANNGTSRSVEIVLDDLEFRVSR